VLLAQRGETEAAKQMEIQAEVAQRSDMRFPSLAHTFLRVDPVKGGFTRGF
jgi:hypothetical protein